MKKNLNDLPLFELFLDFGIGNDWIDIHNDYYCEKVIIDNSKEVSLIFQFSKNKIDVKYNNLCLYFVDYKIINFTYEWWDGVEAREENLIFNPGNFTDYGCLFNLSKCRFFDEQNKIIDIDNFGRKCFMLEFQEQIFEILSMNTFIEIY
ncbi:MAG: hypothetical protein EAZ06_01065 [Cytophagales bacterium]|nr:MAG: hypothetical protein EAZ06_01065 [Cytophagales bacterium]